MANNSANCQRGAVPVIVIIILAAAAILGAGIVGFLLGRGVQGFAPWELRIGDLRVYYDFSEEPKKMVFVRAIGIKDRNIVRIGGEEIQL